MRFHERILAVILACVLSVGIFTACSSSGGKNPAAGSVDMAVMNQLGASENIQENSVLNRLAAFDLEMQPKLWQVAISGSEEERAALEEEYQQKALAIMKDIPSGMVVMYDEALSGVGTTREEAVADLIKDYANSTAVAEAKYCGMAEGTVTMSGTDLYEIVIVLAK